MREKPILFSTPMVQALLNNSKTQTRRVIKDKDIINSFDIGVDGKPIAYIDQATGDSHKPQDICPYKVGMTLWVRETWSKSINGEYVYRTNYGTTEDDSFPPSTFKWRPSIHMPREAARIFLKVTGARVERVQDITEEDAIAEGIESFAITDATLRPTRHKVYGNTCKDTAREAFAGLWDGIYLEKMSGWYDNPWVWVVEFERVEGLE